MTKHNNNNTENGQHHACLIPFRFGESILRLADIHCAAFILNLDSGFTLLCANDKFHQLLGTSASELCIKYGNRMDAVFDADSLRQLSESVKSNAFVGTDIPLLEQCVQLPNGSSKWVSTFAMRVLFEEKIAVCCFSFDTTTDIVHRERLHTLEDVIALVIRRIRYEMFILDTKTGSAQVHTSHTVLHNIFPKIGKSYPDFLKTIIDNNVLAEQSVPRFRMLLEDLSLNGTRSACEIQLQDKTGGTHWMMFSLEYFPMHGESTRYAMGILEDISQQKEALSSYLSETQFFQAILSDKAGYAQVDLTENKILRAGGIWDVYNEIINSTTFSELFASFAPKVVHPDDHAFYRSVMDVSNLIATLERGIDRTDCDFRRIVSQNKMAWMKISIHLFRDSISEHVMALMYLQNIDADKKQHLTLLHENELDGLTNIYNKTAAEEIINAYLHNMLNGELCVLLLLSIDSFQTITTTLGSEISNSVVCRVSDLLSTAFRKDDIIGRFGEDKFILLLKDMDNPDRVTVRLDALYHQLSQQTNPPFSCSIGIAPTFGRTSYDLLFQRAKAALSAAIQDGGSRYTFFDKPSIESAMAIASASSDHPPFAEFEGGESAEFDRFLSDHGDIAYLVNTQTYELIYGNNSFYDRLGITAAQCRSLKCYEAMQGRSTPCPFCSSANWSTERFYVWCNLNRYLEQEFIIKNKLVNWGGREVLLAIAVDIANNKTVADSIENANTESRDILSGIQSMAKAETIAEAMERALETTATYFRASTAQLWEYHAASDSYLCTHEWTADPCNLTYTLEEQTAINDWLRRRKWSGSYLIENPNVILSDSYTLYQMMRTNSILNQRWIPLTNSAQPGLTDYILVQNMTMHFRNISFMESFCEFIAEERRRRALVESIVYASLHDKLTNLLNRGSYDHFIHSNDPDSHHSVGVMFADFDGLKSINTQRGYHVGDKLLAEFSAMLTSTFPEASIFRLNGDEFLVVQFDVSQAMFDSLVRTLSKTVAMQQQFSTSLGHVWDNLEKNLTQMIANASQVMQVNKKRHYDSALEQSSTVRTNMLQELLLSLERREYEIFLQPKVDFKTHSLTGAEALIRYRDKERGIVPPAQFIDMLERNDFIRYIDLFVFEEVCQLLVKWTDRGWECPKVSLNFSRLTLLENDIVESVEAIFNRYNLSKQMIEIEVTESFADMGKGIVSRAVGGLYNSGFSISLDDFGTKYTNLTMLSMLRFNVLKLDRSLCNSLADEPRNQVILKNVISMCHDLNISVIAEGIEEQEQEDILCTLGCQYGQGYLYGKPMEVTEFERRYARFAVPSL